MYLYSISYYAGEEELCSMEIKYLLNVEVKGKFFLSEKYIDVNRSPFIKYMIDIKLCTDTLDEIVDIIKKENISYDNFKVKYFDTEEDMEFNEKHKVEGIIGYVINGAANVKNPDIMLGVTRAYGKWIFGEYHGNKGIWKEHNKKPYQYSNALPANVSRAVANIAASLCHNPKIVDPCCGVGTVVMEGLSMGLDIRGFDINPKIVENARENLKFFSYPDAISDGNIHEITEHYDTAIIDIPYGLLSITTKEIQRSIIKSARRIADRMVLVSLVEMNDDISDAGFEITDRCCVYKGDFKRFITVCICFA